MSASVNSLPARLERIASQVGRELESRLSELAERWYARMSEIPELDPWGSPEIYEAAAANARKDIGREIAGLVAGRVLPVTCPQEVIDSAHLAVSARFPLWACVQSYRTGHAVQWEAYSNAIERRRLDRGARRQLLEAGSEYMFAYADRCSRWVELEYTRERDRRLRSEEQMRIQLVRDLLEAKEVDTGRLGYELEGWHVALLAAGRDAEDLVRGVGRSLGAQVLVVAVEPGFWWGWVRLSRPRPELVERRWRALSLPTGTSLAIGEPEQGPAGFRRSHAQAQYAAAIGARRGRPATRYHDVALEALATADHDQAESFVRRELGPLIGSDRRARTLRQTLRAYFSAAQRASSTAAMLDVHERTVGNRLRTVERMTGHAVHARRAELEVALRIHDLIVGGAHAPDARAGPATGGPVPAR